jgi:hypothetical protein
VDLVKGRWDPARPGQSGGAPAPAEIVSRVTALEDKFTLVDSIRSLLGDADAREVLDAMEERLSRIEAQISTLFTLQRPDTKPSSAMVALED